MLAASTKYALKALLTLVKQPKGEFMQVKSLSEEADVPGPYLAKLIKTLAAKDLVETRRGISGGVRIPARSEPISFLDVCAALDDPIVTQHCMLSRKPCDVHAPCQMHRHWGGIRKQLMEFLEQAKIK